MKWIDEKTAAAMVKRCPRILRRKAKSRAWNINYTTLEGRTYHYSLKDIEKLFDQNSTNRK